MYSSLKLNFSVGFIILKLSVCSSLVLLRVSFIFGSSYRINENIHPVIKLSAILLYTNIRLDILKVKFLSNKNGF